MCNFLAKTKNHELAMEMKKESKQKYEKMMGEINSNIALSAKP